MLHRSGLLLAAWLTAWCWGQAGLPAATLTLTSTNDTGMMSNLPTNNLGRLGSIPAGTTRNGASTRLLLRFDVANRIPPGSIINSAQVRVQVIRDPNFGANTATFGLHRMQVGWTEGTKTAANNGSGASAGEVTWRFRAFPSILWNGGASGVDFASTVSGGTITVVDGTRTGFTFASNSNLVADIRGWLNNPASNFGWMIRAQNEATTGTARRFASREAGIVSQRPTLTVDYTPPPRIHYFALTNNRFVFQFQAFTGRTYRVEHTKELTNVNWTALTTFPVPTVNTNLTISEVPTESARFYRVTMQ